MKTPRSGLLAPVPASVLSAVAAEGLEVIAGTLAHNALVDYEPGDMQWAEDLAVKLSGEHPGTFYAFASHPDYEWLTQVEGGIEISSDEGTFDAERLGLTLVPAPPAPRTYLVVENATPEQVASALGAAPAPRRHLEPTSLGTLGWTEGADLGFLASRVSKHLKRRTFAVVEEGAAFRVRIHESGVETGRFEAPETGWSKTLRVSDVLGATTVADICQKLELPPPP